jgi:hypothetical protein
VDLLAFLEYRVIPTVGINVTGRYDAVLTDVKVGMIEGPPPNNVITYDDLSYRRFQIFLGGRWFY